MRPRARAMWLLPVAGIFTRRTTKHARAGHAFPSPRQSILNLQRRVCSRVRPVELVNCAAIQASASERQIHRQVTRSARPRLERVSEHPTRLRHQNYPRRVDEPRRVEQPSRRPNHSRRGGPPRRRGAHDQTDLTAGPTPRSPRERGRVRRHPTQIVLRVITCRADAHPQELRGQGRPAPVSWLRASTWRCFERWRLPACAPSLDSSGR
jgi:hypothetical protein